MAMVKSSSNFTARSKALLFFVFVDSFCYLCFVFCHTVVSVPCSLVSSAGKSLTSWLCFMYKMFYCVFVTFPYGVTCMG